MIFNDGNFDDAQSENILEYLKNCPDNTHFMLTVDGIGKYESVYAFRVKRTESVVMLVKSKLLDNTYLIKNFFMLLKLFVNDNLPCKGLQLCKEWHQLQGTKGKTCHIHLRL